MKVKPAIAELLLPHILLDLAVYDKGSAVCTLLTDRLERHIFCKPFPDMRVTSLFLDCLNFLHTFHLEALETSKRKSKEEGSELLGHFHKSGDPWAKVEPSSHLKVVQYCLGPNGNTCEKFEHWKLFHRCSCDVHIAFLRRIEEKSAEVNILRSSVLCMGEL